MRNFDRSSSATPKISVKQMNPLNTQPQFYRPGYDQYQTNKQFKYPPNHIQSESSVSCNPSYRQSDIRQKNIRQRRRKIFDRKVFKATVIPYEQKQKKIPTQRNHSLNNQKYHKNMINQQNIHKNINEDSLYDNYYTMNSIGYQDESQHRKGQKTIPKFHNTNESQYQYQTLRNPRQAYQSYQGMNKYYQQSHQSKYPIKSQSKYPQRQGCQQRQHELYHDSAQLHGTNIKSQPQTISLLLNKDKDKDKDKDRSRQSGDIIQSYPSFARNQVGSHLNEGVIQSHTHPQSHTQSHHQSHVHVSPAPQIKQQLNQLHYQLRRIKQQVLTQKQQLSTLSTKVTQSNKQNHTKQKQLINTLVHKHQQLVAKQQQLNHSYDKIVQVQAQSGQRYEQMLKYELELQRARRIQEISGENQRLYMEIVKEEGREKDRQRQRQRQNQSMVVEIASQRERQLLRQTQILRQRQRDKQRQRQRSGQTMDVTPLSHPINNQYLSQSISNNYFRDEHNLREISALQSPYRIDDYEQEQEYDHDNTLRELLSPLEIKPDYQY